MIKNYLILSIRNLVKNKVFSFINIFGLAIGLMAAMLIGAYIRDELSYDSFPEHANQLYRVGIQLDQNGGIADYPHVDVAVGAGIKNTFPEVLASTRILPLPESYVKSGDKQFKESHIAFCDSNFLQMFSIPLLEGDARTALNTPREVVISRSFAQRYFGNDHVIGKTLDMFGGVKVTGEFDKIPDNAHFHYDALVSMATNRGAMTGTTWSNIGFYTYLLLDKGADPKKLEAQFPQLTEKYVVPEAQHDMGASLAEARKALNNWRFYLIPIRSIHLESHTKYEMEANGDKEYVYIFGALAVFILILACVNFTNLSTAGSANRSREVGIRKVLGSLKNQLIFQFLTEAILLAFCAMLLALLICFLLLPYFNNLAGKHFSFWLFLKGPAICAILGLVLLAGILGGIYPAFFLSSFQPIVVLKGISATTSSGKSRLRSGLVVFQFMISTGLIIATLVVYRQLHFMQNKKLGFEKEQVLMIEDTYALHKAQYAFKQELLKDPRVVNVTISRDAPVNRVGTETDGSEVYAKENKANESASEIHAFFFHVDYDYLATLGMKIAAGRYFSPSFRTDSTGVVINESAVRDLGWKSDQDALDKIIVSSGLHEYRVIGVVADFNYTSAKQKIAPLMMMLGSNNGSMMVKIKTAEVAGFIADLKKQWMSFNRDTPFSYYFLDDRFASLYSAEQKTGRIFTLFSVIAIVIACMGLFGLVSFITEQRAKEVGIRKVLGASVDQLFYLLSKEFLLLVAVAFFISIPLAWWGMHFWLNNFAYRTPIPWWAFGLAGSFTICIALVTVSFQALKAALTNPVKTLRTE
jgi:putative ABC transport system permease protein